MKRTILDFFKGDASASNVGVGLNSSKKGKLSTNEIQGDTSTSTVGSQEAIQCVQTHEVYKAQQFYDIGQAVGKVLDDSQKVKFLRETWKPDKSYVFPIQEEGKQMRKFQYEWLEEHKWLAYSDYKKGAFCKMCVLFAPFEAGVGSQALGSLVKEPLSKYKKARAAFREHESKKYHEFSVTKASNFTKTTLSETTVTIAVQLDKQKAAIVEANRKRLRPIIKSILFCAQNNLPLRGHRDDGELILSNNPSKIEADNCGVFRNLLKFRVDAGDHDLKTHLETSGKNCTMISKTIQNEIVHSIGKVVKTAIVQNIKKSKYFSILCDETTDISTKEQMTFCVRYFDADDSIIKEEFLGFAELQSTTGQNIKEVISKELSQLGLSFENLRGQGYDGGGNMAGKFNGVQALIKAEQPLALYTHCFSHCLNLCISKSCEITAIRNMMGIVGSISTFLSASAKRASALEQTISDVAINETKKKKLKALCQTRWVERHESIITFKQLLAPITTTLEDLEGDTSSDTSSKASMFSASIKRSDFIIALEVSAYLLSHTLSLSKFLQSPKQDLSTAFTHLNNVKTVFKNIRENADSEFHLLYKKSCEIAVDIGTTISMPRICQRQTQRNNIDATTAEDYYRKAIFVPFVDHISLELKTRFEGLSDVLPIEGLIPANLSKYKDEDILKAISMYDQDLPGSVLEVSAEIKLWRHRWENVSNSVPSNAVDTLKEIDSLFFPNIKILLHIFAVLPVTTATAERSFSALKRIKTYLRNTMVEERLNGLALVNINKTRNVDIDQVINDFGSTKHRRLELSNWSNEV